MSYSTRAPYRSQPTAEAMQDLAMQIEALQVRPAPRSGYRSRNTPPHNTSANPAMQESPQFAKNDQRIASHPPQVAAGRTNIASNTIGPDTDNHLADEPRGRRVSRTDSQNQAPPTPEVSRKRAPPPVSPALNGRDGHTPPRRTSGRSSMDAVIEEAMADIAKAREDRAKERERLKDSMKLTATTLNPPRVYTRDRFRVQIVPDRSHATMWDGTDDDIYPWAGTLVVQDTSPQLRTIGGARIKHFEIQFRAIGYPTADSTEFLTTLREPEYYLWCDEYSGHRIPASEDPKHVPELKPQHGIVVEKNYVCDQPKDANAPLTWRVRFWVPVPFDLFASAEHRTFLCEAKVTVQDEDARKTVVAAESISVGIERLRTERLLAVPRGTLRR